MTQENAASGFALFATAIGPCGIAWNPRGICAVQLPEGSQTATRVRLRQRFPELHLTTPPAEIQRAIDDIVALLDREGTDLNRIRLDMDGVPEFRRRVYDLVRAIAPGETLTYGEIATRLGSGASAQAVGQALGRNPFPIIVPCHRVLAADGQPGGFSARGGVETKMRLLTLERATVAGSLLLDF